MARGRHRGFARDGASLRPRADHPDAEEQQVLDDSLVAMEGADPDLVRTREAGRVLVVRIEDPALDVEPQDVIDQIEDYRALFETLLAERAPP